MIAFRCRLRSRISSEMLVAANMEGSFNVSRGPRPDRIMEGVRVVLISTYELGRQPFGLASPAAWLRAAGHQVTVADLAITHVPGPAVDQADLIAFYLPMHTATRIFLRVLDRVKAANPWAHLVAYGLYAPLNAPMLRRNCVDSILGGEFEQGLVELA